MISLAGTPGRQIITHGSCCSRIVVLQGVSGFAFDLSLDRARQYLHDKELVARVPVRHLLGSFLSLGVAVVLDLWRVRAGGVQYHVLSVSLHEITSRNSGYTCVIRSLPG